MYKFIPIYNEEGELFEDLIIKIINNKIKYDLELDLSDSSNVKLLADR